MQNRNVNKRLALPSLDLLKGFEAAARNLSFTLAGKELFLTQSAVSRQVKALEDQLGVALFERRHRALLLTEAGQILYRTAADILRQLEETTDKLNRSDASRLLSMSTTVAFASLWLIPRLGGFRERQPDIDVRVSATNDILDLKRERLDLAIRYCAPEAAPSGARKLFGEEVFAVCSESLLRQPEQPLAHPEDLRHHVLLQLDDAAARWPWLDWSVWLQAMGVPQLKPAGTLRFSHYEQLIQAAIDGQGVALGRSPLVKNLILQRRLIAPFSERAASSRAYFLVVAADAARRKEVQRFADWLVEITQREAEEESTNENEHKARRTRISP